MLAPYMMREVQMQGAQNEGACSGSLKGREPLPEITFFS